MAFSDFLKRRRASRKALPSASSSTEQGLIGSTQIEDDTPRERVPPIEVRTRRYLGVEVTTVRWDSSRDLVSLLEDLHAVSEEGGIAPDDLAEQKREILGVPEPVDLEGLEIEDLWKIGKWLVGRGGASLSRTDDPAWQVERLQRLRQLGSVTDREFSYLERELLHPRQTSLRRRFKDLKELWGRP